MKKNQIYNAFQQERYQIEERLKLFKQEIGGGGFSGSWNDLTDKPFYGLEGMTVEVPVVNGEFIFDLPGVTMEQECIITYSGDYKYTGWEKNLLDLASIGFAVSKYPTSALVDIEVTDAGVHCTGRIVNGDTGETLVDAIGTITVVVSSVLVTLDDKYISKNIARTSQIPSKASELENDSNYISKAELQNILNQIKLSVAEDGTISINIPTIS